MRQSDFYSKTKTMKKIILTCSVFAAMICTATAQVSKKDFMTKANELASVMHLGNLQSEETIYLRINTMMLSEISFLTSQGKAGAEKLKIVRGLRDEVANQQAAISRGG